MSATFSAYVITATSLPGADAGMIVQLAGEDYDGVDYTASPEDIGVADEAFDKGDFDALLEHLGFERADDQWADAGDQWTCSAVRA